MSDKPNNNQARPERRRVALLPLLGLLLLLTILIFLIVKVLQGPPALNQTAPASEAAASTEDSAASQSTENVPASLHTEHADTQSAESTAPDTEPAPETEPPEPQVQTVTFLALGDNLMHTSVLEAGLQPDGSYDFHDLYRYIADEVQSVDIACINQETIFINDPSQFSGYPIFGGPVEIGEALVDTGFDVFTQSTNHCYDKFSVGIRDTLAFWRQYPQVTVLGIHDSPEDAAEIRVVECNGIRIAMLNYTYGTNMGRPAESWEIDWLDRDRVSRDIAKAKEVSDLILVFPHWGTENTFRPDSFQREWAEFFVSQGVDAVIGCHPHTLQPLEIMTGPDGKQVPVFWSMGNFISHMLGNQNMLGGMARLTFVKDEDGIRVQDWELVPTMTYGSEESGKWVFYGMRLEDYTDEMAASHFVEHTTPAEMWDLYRQIVGDE